MKQVTEFSARADAVPTEFRQAGEPGVGTMSRDRTGPVAG